MSNETEQNKASRGQVVNVFSLDNLRSNWFVLAFLVSMGITWGTFTQKDKVQETRIEILELKVEKADTAVDEIGKTLVEINTTLKFIEQKLNEPE